MTALAAEWRAPLAADRSRGARLTTGRSVVSSVEHGRTSHLYGGLPERLQGRVRRRRACRADCVRRDPLSHNILGDLRCSAHVRRFRRPRGAEYSSVKLAQLRGAIGIS